MTFYSPVPGGNCPNSAAVFNSRDFLSILQRPHRVGKGVSGTVGVVTDLGRIQELQQAAGELHTLSRGGVPAARSPGPGDLVMMNTNAGRFDPAGGGNEQLGQKFRRRPRSRNGEEFLTLLRPVQEDPVLDFVTMHPDWTASVQ